jgi:SAM-dependent methyltransferase
VRPPLKRLFALGYDVAVGPLELAIASRRKKLLRNAFGRILEIGPGTGVNLSFLPGDCDWTGVEPNFFMSQRLHRRFPSRKVVAGVAEALPFGDHTFDTCICTLVLCSVRDLESSLSEIRRVLRPGGSFLFLEHILAPPDSFVRTLQYSLYWPWRCLGDGCRINRNSLEAIRLHFAEVDAETYWAPWWSAPPWVRYQVAGTAR